jgi:hypothetical protein
MPDPASLQAPVIVVNPAIRKYPPEKDREKGFYR